MSEFPAVDEQDMGPQSAQILQARIDALEAQVAELQNIRDSLADRMVDLEMALEKTISYLRLAAPGAPIAQLSAVLLGEETDHAS
jgi:hypothetical protein